MNKRIFLAALLLAILFISCTRYAETEKLYSDEGGLRSSSQYAISVELALESLFSFLEIEDTCSKAPFYVISDVSIIDIGDLCTKSDSGVEENYSLLYLVNFIDNGYAVLSADNRISDPVICVVEEGNISCETFLDDVCSINTYSYLDNYPDDGEPFFYDNRYPDELFINPNYFGMYNENEQDSLVGDYLCDDSVSSSRQFLNQLCVCYALNEISRYGYDDHGHSINGMETTSVIIETVTTITPKVYPILQQEKNWRQGFPFNDLCPVVHSYLLFGDQRKAYAGCVPLSVAKIMAHFEWPTNVFFNGTKVDWYELKKNYNSLVGRQSVASLLRLVGMECNSLYFYEGTFTFPGRAASFMSDCMFPDVELVDYSTSCVKSMLDSDCPVFICSVPSSGALDFDLSKSHAWNIDGYKIMETLTTKEIYVNGNYVRTDVQKDVSTIVHCDFGWQGRCNGYYASGLFKLNGANAVYDNPNDIGKDVNYNAYLKIISYSHPY